MTTSSHCQEEGLSADRPQGTDRAVAANMQEIAGTAPTAPALCPACSRWTSPEARFCPACGFPLRLPVQLAITYPAKQSRLLLLVKWAAVLPHLVFLWVYGLLEGVVSFISVIVVLVTGRYPLGLFDVSRSYLQRQYRVAAYFPYLLTDSWRGDGVNLRVDHPGRLSRGLALVRLLVGGFAVMATVGAGVIAVLFGFLAGWVILVRGRYPQGLFSYRTKILDWQARVAAWVSNLSDEGLLFRAPKRVWIPSVAFLGVYAVGVVATLVATVLFYETLEKKQGQKVVEDYLAAGRANNVDAAAALFAGADRREIEETFKDRTLFDGYTDIEVTWWDVEEREIWLDGTVRYSAGEPAELEANLIRSPGGWKLDWVDIYR